jgi:hypothetical protein
MTHGECIYQGQRGTILGYDGDGTNAIIRVRMHGDGSVITLRPHDVRPAYEFSRDGNGCLVSRRAALQ